MTAATNATGEGFAALSSLTELIEGVGGAARLGGWEAVMQIDFTDEAARHLMVTGSGLSLRPGTHIKPTVVIRGRGADLARAFNGEVDMTQLLARGQATSDGPVSRPHRARPAHRRRQEGAPGGRREGSLMSLSRKVAVVGLGQMPFKTRYPDRNYQELAFEASALAMDDAGIGIDDISSAVYAIYSDMLLRQQTPETMIHEYLGLGGQAGAAHHGRRVDRHLRPPCRLRRDRRRTGRRRAARRRAEVG